MSNYFELHTLELKGTESHPQNVKEKTHDNSSVKELKEKIISVEKNQKQKSKQLKIKIIILLFLSHTFVYLLATALQPTKHSDGPPKDSVPTMVRDDEVLLSLSLVLFSNFQKLEKAKWVDLYSPAGMLIIKKVVVLKKESNDDDFDPQDPSSLTPTRYYDVIVKKKDAPLLLTIAKKSYHALPHGINIPQTQKIKKPIKSPLRKKRDPFEKPWSQS